MLESILTFDSNICSKYVICFMLETIQITYMLVHAVGTRMMITYTVRKKYN